MYGAKHTFMQKIIFHNLVIFAFLSGSITQAGTFGQDDRQDVTEPPAWMGALVIMTPGKKAFSTGFFIRENILVSAQHTYVKPNTSELYTQDALSIIYISASEILSKDETLSNAYESKNLVLRGAEYSRPTDNAIPDDWDALYSTIGDDWIVIEMKNTPLLTGNSKTKPQTFIEPAILNWEKVKLPIDVEVIGYSKPYPAKKSKCKLLYVQELPPTKQSPVRRLLHTDCDTAHGFSGAALTTIVRDTEGHEQTRVIGLMSLGYEEDNLTFYTEGKQKVSSAFVSIENFIHLLPNQVTGK
jgi:hypothetical protein